MMPVSEITKEKWGKIYLFCGYPCGNSKWHRVTVFFLSYGWSHSVILHHTAHRVWVQDLIAVEGGFGYGLRFPSTALNTHPHHESCCHGSLFPHGHSPTWHVNIIMLWNFRVSPFFALGHRNSLSFLFHTHGHRCTLPLSSPNCDRPYAISRFPSHFQLSTLSNERKLVGFPWILFLTVVGSPLWDLARWIS